MAYTTINKSTDYFNTKLYTGTGSENVISGVGHQPDWTWIKNRGTTDWHRLLDAVRGATKEIYSNATDGESTLAQSLKSFNTDGFTLGTLAEVNTSSENYASWNWKAGGGQGSSNTDGSINTTYTSVNTTAGFSISTYTGNGSAGATVGHGLGVTPNIVIIKRRSSSEAWAFWSSSLAGNTSYLRLNATDAVGTASDLFNSTTPSNSLVTLGTGGFSNTNTETYVMYCFAEKTGYSKFGSYTGNGNADGTFVYTGFKPAWVLVKNSQQGGDHWYIWDNKRPGYNQIQKYLGPSRNNAEADSSSYAIDMVSNGFKIRSSTGAINNNGETIVYMAFGQSLVGSNNVPATAR